MCYFCDDKWQQGYRYVIPRLYLLEQMELFDNAMDEVVEQQTKSQSVLKDTMKEDGLVALNDASISLHAMVSTTNPRTMRVHGLIDREQVVIMVKTGSTHNFLDIALVHKCKLAIQRGHPIQIKVANGDVLTNDGRIAIVPFFLQGIEFKFDIFTLPLGGCNAVVGI